MQYRFQDAPQLGTEPVRGSGCGADGSLGDVIPDGWWYGLPVEWGSTSFRFDVMCVYFGESAAPYIAECDDDPEPDICLESGSPDFWLVNNSTRTRSVPYDPDIVIVNENAANCTDYNPRQVSYISLIHIVDGEAVALTTTCPGG